ncbi:hypothetical protein GmHk_13G037085 [Glycine max]|nr:hypothetical protein GmHk_13G037085 [Glycine max]
MAEIPTSSFGANTEKNPKEECRSEEGRVDKEEKKEEEEKKLAREARKEVPPAPLKEPPYPLVPSKKNKERYFKHFLEIFKGEEEKDLRTCLEDLDHEENILARGGGGTDFEELKSGGLSEKTKVELKILPSHLEYLFLGGERDQVYGDRSITRPYGIVDHTIS